jgi:hypothetical protein
MRQRCAARFAEAAKLLGRFSTDAIGAQPQTHHDGCGGRAGKAELLTGIEGVSSRPVRRIVVLDG